MSVVAIVRRSCSLLEQFSDEGDLVDHPDFKSFELAFSNGAKGFDTGERGLGSGQCLEPAHGTQSLLQRGMITLDPIVQILAVNVADCILRPEPAVDLADHLCRAVSLVVDDCKRLIAPNGVSGPAQKGPCCPGIPPCREAEIDQLAELNPGPPMVRQRPPIRS